MRTIPTKEELEKIAKDQGLKKPKGKPDIPKRPSTKYAKSRTAPPPPEGSIPAPTPAPKKPPRKIGNLDKANEQIADLKKQLKSERGRANAHERYRKAEDEEHMVALEQLNQAHKDRDDARDRVKELEKVPEKKTVSTIQIGGQTHWRNNRGDARAMVKKLIDEGVWFFSVGEAER